MPVSRPLFAAPASRRRIRRRSAGWVGFGLGIVLCVGACFAGWAVVGADRVTGPASPSSTSEALDATRRIQELEQVWEQRLVDHAQRALAPAFGDRVVVAVRVEIDPTMTTSVGINPPASGLQPNLVVVDRSRPENQTAGDVRVPEDPARVPAAPRFESRLRRPTGTGTIETRQTDPALYGSRTATQHGLAVRRISASITVDAALFETVDRETTTAAIADLVRHAIGFDPARGDQLCAPAVVPFAQGTVDEVGMGGWITSAVLAGLVVLLAGGWAWCGIRRRRSPVAATVPTDRPGAESGDPLADRMRESIESAIDGDPEAVSRMLGEWATEAGQ